MELPGLRRVEAEVSIGAAGVGAGAEGGRRRAPSRALKRKESSHGDDVDGVSDSA